MEIGLLGLLTDDDPHAFFVIFATATYLLDNVFVWYVFCTTLGKGQNDGYCQTLLFEVTLLNI